MSNSLTQLLVLVLLLLVTTACRKPIENPESIHPIYADLENERKSAAAALEAEKKSLEEAKKRIETLEARDIERPALLREISRREKAIVQLRQKTLYFEIRRDQRKEYVKVEYLKAFNAEKPWPIPEDVAAYKKTKELQSASRSWDSRVPKSDRYSKQSPLQQPAPVKEEAAAKPAH